MASALQNEPCKNCGGLRVVRYNDGPLVCPDCLSARRKRARLNKGKKKSNSRSEVAIKQRNTKIATMLGAGISTLETSKAVGVSVQKVRNIRNETRYNPELLDQFRIGQETAAAEVLPLAREAAIKSLVKGLQLLEGQNASVGKTKDGQAIMARIDPSLGHVAQFTREAAAIAGVGRGSVLSTDQDMLEKASAGVMPTAGGINIRIDAPNLAMVLKELARSEREQTAIEVKGDRVE